MKQNKGMGGHESAIMRTDEWITPPEIIGALGMFDLDPCSPVNRPWDTAKKHYTIHDNGLVKDWYGQVWLNPPYGREIGLWMQRMAEHGQGVALIFARTETQFFQQYVFQAADSILFLDGRLRFCNTAGIRSQANAGAPSVLISYGEENIERLQASTLKGKHVFLKPVPIIVVGISSTWCSVVSIALNQFGDNGLEPIYDMVERMAPDKVARNRHWKAKIRQQVQVLRRRTA